MSTDPPDTLPFTVWHADPDYPDPLPTDLKRPEFEAVWQAIKGWDLSRRASAAGSRLYAPASGNDVMHILRALPPDPTTANDTRESIRAYLRHVADVEVGTVLTPAGRELIGFCASWVQNRLDEQWLKDKVVPFPSKEKPVEPAEEPTESRRRKEAEETVEALRADLEEERRLRDRAEVLLGGVRSEVLTWETYAEEPGDDNKSMRRIRDMVAPRPTLPDLMHPTGRCSCGGEGRCDWCKANPDPYQEDPPPAAAILEVMQDTQAYIEKCLAAGPKLDAVRQIVQQYNHPGNEKFGSLVAMQKITEVLAGPDTPEAVLEDPLDLRQALDGTKEALRAEMARCQEAEAKLKAIEEVVESTTVGEWRDMTGYKRLHILLVPPEAHRD